MSQMLVAEVDDELAQRLEQRAASHGRTPAAEHRAILEDVLRPDKAKFLREAERLRRQTAGRDHTDSAELIRADRNRDGAPW